MTQVSGPGFDNCSMCTPFPLTVLMVERGWVTMKELFMQVKELPMKQVACLSYVVRFIYGVLYRSKKSDGEG